jgi:hypothetical protein
MPTFLRSSLTGCRRYDCARAVPLLLLLLLALILSVDVKAQSASGPAIPASSNSTIAAAAAVSLDGPGRKRIVMLQRIETPDGPRFTLKADAPLDDYRSFAEGERICVMIPQAAFVTARNDNSGRGFADLRIEQRETGVMLSFRLQQGATVAVNQNFNRLNVSFITNERANLAKSN